MAKGQETSANETPDAAPKAGRIRTENNDEAFLRYVTERLEYHQTFWSDIHEDGRKDDKFVAGHHWPEKLKQEREEDGRPCLTYNLIPSFHRQITNRIRQQRPAIRAVPVERNRSEKTERFKNMAGTSDYSHADIMSGIIKNIETVSRADQAYDTATKHAVDHGFGFFYLMPERDPRDPFVQTLRIYRVKDSYTVTLDPDAQEADYRDAQDGFIEMRMPRQHFEAKYPDAATSESLATGTLTRPWFDGDNVLIMQYIWLEYEDDEVLKLTNGKTVWFSDVEDVLDELEKESGIRIATDANDEELRMDVKRPVAHWAKVTARDVLEETELPFSAVPIFFVSGEEVIVEARVSYESASRHAHDAMRSYNYWRTAAAETVALAPKAPWVLTPEQIAGHEKMWRESSHKNLPYLLYNEKRNQHPPKREFPTQQAAAELSNATQDGIDIQTIIGLHDASLGRESNEKSGRAISERKEQGNTSTFQFPDNLSRALDQMGRLICEAVPQLFDTQRIERIRLPDDTEDFVELNQRVQDRGSDKDALIHDISMIRYDVVMDTSGVDYTTQRREAAELQMDMLKVLGPEKASNIVHLIIKNLGMPGSDEVYEILRKMLPDQLKTDEEKNEDLPEGVRMGPEGQPVDEDGNPWQPPPTMEQQIAQKEQQLRELEHQANTEKHKATQATAQADREKAQATQAQAEADKAEAQKELAALQNQQATENAAENVPQVDMEEVARLAQQVMQEHERAEDAHAKAIDERVEQMVTETLRRVKGYVDDQMARLAEPEAGPKAIPAGGDDNGGQQ